ncbi:YesL family protein [Nonomuraea sp. NPDC050783]|uniref:YesL family protein n=1 Tax=Nonomuraea sp. NPDC050783 TaxID=3154634 RepID=UPI0034651510
MSHPAMSMKVQAVCSEIFWVARLNLLWIVFTLLGGVVLGLGPATVAAYTLARRHHRHESFQVWAAFWSVYRREFVRASLLVLPLVLAATVLAGNYLYLSALGSGAGALRAVTYVALVALAAVGAYLGPLYVHYELPLWGYIPKASLLALTRPASTVLLLFVLAAIVFAATTVPALAPLVSVGAWIYLNTWLCLRFFAENEARLLAKGNS